MSKINQIEQKETGRIKLSDDKDFIDSLIDNEELASGEKYELDRR